MAQMIDALQLKDAMKKDGAASAKRKQGRGRGRGRSTGRGRATARGKGKGRGVEPTVADVPDVDEPVAIEPPPPTEPAAIESLPSPLVPSPSIELAVIEPLPEVAPLLPPTSTEPLVQPTVPVEDPQPNAKRPRSGHQWGSCSECGLQCGPVCRLVDTPATHSALASGSRSIEAGLKRIWAWRIFFCRLPVHDRHSVSFCPGKEMVSVGRRHCGT